MVNIILKHFGNSFAEINGTAPQTVSFKIVFFIAIFVAAVHVCVYCFNKFF